MTNTSQIEAIYRGYLNDIVPIKRQYLIVSVARSRDYFIGEGLENRRNYSSLRVV